MTIANALILAGCHSKLRGFEYTATLIQYCITRRKKQPRYILNMHEACVLLGLGNYKIVHTTIQRMLDKRSNCLFHSIPELEELDTPKAFIMRMVHYFEEA